MKERRATKDEALEELVRIIEGDLPFFLMARDKDDVRTVSCGLRGPKELAATLGSCLGAVADKCDLDSRELLFTIQTLVGTTLLASGRYARPAVDAITGSLAQAFLAFEAGMKAKAAAPEKKAALLVHVCPDCLEAERPCELHLNSQGGEVQ